MPFIQLSIRKRRGAVDPLALHTLVPFGSSWSLVEAARTQERRHLAVSNTELPECTATF
jgi:hypothetical protein